VVVETILTVLDQEMVDSAVEVEAHQMLLTFLELEVALLLILEEMVLQTVTQ
jgi:hypothetical protein